MLIILSDMSSGVEGRELSGLAGTGDDGVAGRLEPGEPRVGDGYCLAGSGEEADDGVEAGGCGTGAGAGR